MSEFQIFLNEQLKDDEFRKEWEDIQSEMDALFSKIYKAKTHSLRHFNPEVF